MGFALLREELISRGYVYKALTLGRLYKQYFTPAGKLVITKTAYYDYPFVSYTAREICLNKAKSYQLAQNLGVTIPHTVHTSDLQVANDFLARYKRVVVKPHNLGGSKGLTLNVTEPGQLKAAIDEASVGDEVPLIQEQFIGEEIRFTVIAGKVHSAILRQTPRVVGNGHSTVAELVDVENKARETLQFPTLSYPQLTNAIIPEALLRSSRVPLEGEIIEFSNATMIRGGASFYGILNEVHQSLVALVERMAANVNPPFLVIDIMVKQWKSELQPEDYIFLEFNTAPALEIYTSIRAGETPDTIARLADLVDEYAHIAI